MNEPIAQWIFAFNKWCPSVSILLCIMFLDVVMGTLVAFGTKKLSSSASYNGILKKVGIIIIVMTASLIDLAAGETNFLTMKMVSLGFSLSEAWSITENAGKLGIQIPESLAAALIKLHPAKIDTPTPTQQPTVTVQHASNVNLPAMDSGSSVNIHQDSR